MEDKFYEVRTVFEKQAFPGEIKGSCMFAPVDPRFLHFQLVSMPYILFTCNGGGFCRYSFAAFSSGLYGFIVAIPKPLSGGLTGEKFFQVVR